MKRTFVFLLVLMLAASSAEAKKIRVYTPKTAPEAAAPAVPAPAPSSAAEEPEVRNLIYMIGDGMGLTHVSMLMLEEEFVPTAFNHMQNIALVSTYSANNRVTDSAAAGTALATGQKTDNSRLGVTPDGTPVESIFAKAVRKQIPAGFVVTCKVQHATPGAFYAHAESRKQYDIISHQLAESGLTVAFGGGKKEMLTPDATGTSAVDKLLRQGCRVIYDWSEAEDIRSGRVVGLFADDHMPSELNGRGDYLPHATRKALEILDNEADGKGFVLMVEGSQIDFESQDNNTAGILAEMRDFEAAIVAAMRFADNHPGTLLVVTADHETGGLSAPSGKADFTASESGISYRYGTGGHTGTLVPAYFYGTGAELLNGVMDNTELARRLTEILHL